MFEGFRSARLEGIDGCGIHLVHGGSGPPLLLLHGYPQTHVEWHKVAPSLAERFTVVCPDLRGYGDSDKPAAEPQDFETYCKRTSANDQVVVMRLRHGFIARSAIPEIMPVEYPGFFEQPHCPGDCSD